MFREENTAFGLSAAEEKQRNRDVVKGTALSFFALCGFIRLCKFFYVLAGKNLYLLVLIYLILKIPAPYLLERLVN